ncbi:CCAAT/enhancer-binding protein gamma-like [Homalodisca vitripennis]|uniref:CCAAT/enhancer-binding protein gamma-like n=1 Tax=Homalodisca vitripennis TaxID=197043 RepID=UPI001EECB2F1|nr:CCAAT/enhancer-binding protein gamma-like [Homalodisca vitripennis]XP_046671806.1 CCAAT/enhancer-binding protein gamma-like [Homalodisca vitripennis]
MARALSRKLKNNGKYSEQYRERRRKNNEAVRKTRAKERTKREKIPADIINLVKENYFLAGQIKVNLKNLNDYLQNADMECLRQSEEFDIDKLLRDSDSILVKYKPSSA